MLSAAFAQFTNKDPATEGAQDKDEVQSTAFDRKL
jgi:hypothetical protein